MTEGNRSLSANYTLNSDVQSRIDEAVNAAKGEPVDVKATAEYAELRNERDMLRAISGDAFAAVKPKFREQVFKMLDRTDGAPTIDDQLRQIGEKYEEYFAPQENQPEEKPKAPSFGAPAQGSAPTGKQGPTFGDVWGFVPKK